MTTIKTSSPVRVHIRWMIRRDMPEVLAIEAASFRTPWGEEEFLEALRQRNTIGMVAEHGDRIVGFMIYSLHKTRIDVTNLAVHPDYRRRGVGRQMAAKLLGKLSALRRTRLELVVSEVNLAACLWLRDGGFRAVEVIRGDDHDDYRFAFDVAGHPA